MNYKDILERMLNALKATAESVERDLSISQVWSQAYAAIQGTMDEWIWIDDLYRGTDGELYAIAIRDGKLWQYAITVDNDQITVSDPVEVIVSFSEVGRSSISVQRDAATGKRRWFAIAAAAVLNRVGEIDSRALFDSFQEAVARGDAELPYFTVYHQGLSLRIGTVDYQYRDGDLFFNSGLLDEEGDNADLARAVGDLLETEAADEWGISIGFMPTKNPDILRINDTIEIPVYTEGYQVEASLLLERHAASLMTTCIVRERTLMPNKRSAELKEALEKFFPNNADMVEDVLARADERQRQITEGGMITRDQLAETSDVDESDTEIVISDELLAEVVEQARAKMAADFQKLEDQFKADLQTEREAREKDRVDFEKRLKALQKPIAQQVEEELADQPRKRVVTISRPRDRAIEDDGEAEESAETFDDLAAATKRQIGVN